jgi:uncharacterized small protein (DUF1192 family)
MTHDDDTCPHLVRVNLLEAENARLEADNDRLKEAIADSYKAVDEMEQRFKALEAEFETHPMAAEIARLKAEVERLTKAGDAMVSFLWAENDDENFNGAISYIAEKVENDWHNAKEGKPKP